MIWHSTIYYTIVYYNMMIYMYYYMISYYIHKRPPRTAAAFGRSCCGGSPPDPRASRIEKSARQRSHAPGPGGGGGPRAGARAGLPDAISASARGSRCLGAAPRGMTLGGACAALLRRRFGQAVVTRSDASDACPGPRASQGEPSKLLDSGKGSQAQPALFCLALT